jgi:hypothetical protein
MQKPLREEQAEMRARWSDPAYQWANNSDLRRKFHASGNVAASNAVHQTGHNVAEPMRGGSAEAETKGDKD